MEQQFYAPNTVATDKTFEFDSSESKHILKVLRHQKGDEIVLNNGQGLVFKAQITEVSLKKCSVQLLECIQRDPSNYSVHIAIAPTKSIDRFEWFLEKAVELGIGCISPIICDHSERRHLKMERMNRIILSGFKQSMQAFLPQINEPVSLDDFLKKTTCDHGYYGDCLASTRNDFFHHIVPEKATLIIIGPEGDFSTRERNLFMQHNIKSVSLGQQRLRVETAGISALSRVHLANLKQ
ncbi:MAG: 16S rRNA (uracil(1498)-N(3))-methyltransferase [Flavobacteriaceae bacterium]|nr:16S rRNA (uracil(1498)-N(3))-methyltransferase [Flavobacteriaceae bacterium]